MSVTIVSACDRNYLWGAFLLAASAARHTPNVPFHLLHTGFAPEDRALLQQFSNVSVLELSAENRHNVCNRKPEALLTGDTEYIAWLDADCMIVGDIRPLLIPENNEFQIRLREPSENGWVWRDHYAAGEERGGLPASVLSRWRQDVRQLELPRLSTTCVTNALVLHRRHLDFIREWRDQIAKVLPAGSGVVDPSLHGYFMSDESVLTSLLVFSRNLRAQCLVPDEELMEFTKKWIKPIYVILLYFIWYESHSQRSRPSWRMPLGPPKSTA
jgi:hypothetical protein